MTVMGIIFELKKMLNWMRRKGRISKKNPQE
jgi:hypothetical protein